MSYILLIFIGSTATYGGEYANQYYCENAKAVVVQHRTMQAQCVATGRKQ